LKIMTEIHQFLWFHTTGVIIQFKVWQIFCTKCFLGKYCYIFKCIFWYCNTEQLFLKLELSILLWLYFIMLCEKECKTPKLKAFTNFQLKFVEQWNH
jgi:hypothetical protein